MNKYINYVNEFHEGNENELSFINNKLKGGESQDDVEHILDFLYATKKDLKEIGYKTILEKANAWNEKLIKNANVKEKEIEGLDYEVVQTYGEYSFVKLISENAFKREGKLMSHCVGSYYGRGNTAIYSLRDEKNLPHCTIEEGQQIKGKGNGNINPKYVDYVVKFLEKLGMTVGKNEMKNLGYYSLDSIDENLSCKALYNGFIYKENLEEIKNEKGQQYYGWGLFNIKKVVEINIKKLVDYVINKSTATSGDYSHSATSGDSSNSATSGDYSHSATSGNYSPSATSGNYSHSATSGNYSHSATSGDSSNSVTSGYSSNSVTSGNYSPSATSGNYSHSATSGNYSPSATSGYYSHSATSGDYSHSATSGKNSISCSIGYNSKAKSTIGNFIVLSEIDKNYIVKDVKSIKVDGKIIKENVFYKLKNGKFIIAN